MNKLLGYLHIILISYCLIILYNKILIVLLNNKIKYVPKYKEKLGYFSHIK